MVEGRHLEKRLSDATFGLHVSKVFDAANDSQNRPQWYCHEAPSNGYWASGKMKLVGQAAQIECIEDSVGTLVGASPIRTGETIAQDLV